MTARLAGARAPDTRHRHYRGQILRGAKASEIPIQQATTFRLIINLKTAKALGVAIPPSFLARADQVNE